MKELFSPASVLLVEDEPAIRMLTRLWLRSACVTAVAANFEEAQHALHHSYDLFLIDIHLGYGHSGIELLQFLRQLPQHSTTPAIAFTASARSDEGSRFLAEGFDGFISKPFTKDDLLSAVAQTLAVGRRIPPGTPSAHTQAE